MKRRNLIKSLLGLPFAAVFSKAAPAEDNPVFILAGTPQKTGTIHCFAVKNESRSSRCDIIETSHGPAFICGWCSSTVVGRIYQDDILSYGDCRSCGISIDWQAFDPTAEGAFGYRTDALKRLTAVRIIPKILLFSDYPDKFAAHIRLQDEAIGKLLTDKQEPINYTIFRQVSEHHFVFKTRT